MKKFIVCLFLMHLAVIPVVVAEDKLTAEQEQYLKNAREMWDSMKPKRGKVDLPNGVASLNVPDAFYYLSPADSKKVLEDVWGNPPGTSHSILGMLFPSGSTPFDGGAWGVTIEYEEDGHVSDSNANSINYDELLSQMQQSAREASKERVRQGYEAIELVGWASKPYYDSTAKKLYWAKELKFGRQEINTLNYNIRVLGRKGVLVLNFIAGMDQKKIIDSKLDTVLAIAEFNQGSRYADFDPSIDKVAAYGIGALVAGKVLAKTGALAALLIFLKKFGVFIFIGIAALFGKLFGGKSRA